MDQGVNPRRYDATRRQDLARQRRTAVLQAALELITTVGYPAMTMGAVARRAGVSVEFIYKAFTDKPGLTRQLLDFAAGGDDEPVPMSQRPAVLAMIAEPDPRLVLRGYAAMAVELNGRAAGLLLALAGAAPANETLASIWETSQRQRHAGAGSVVADVAGKGELRITHAQGQDIVWTLIGPEVYQLLTVQRSWTPARYGEWLAHMLISSLLGEGAGP